MFRRHKYNLNEKRRIVAEAYLPGVSVRAVGRKYSIDAKCISSWKSSLITYDPMKINSKRKTIHTGPEFKVLLL